MGESAVRPYIPDEDPLLTVGDMAELLRVSENYVRKRCQLDEWPHLVQPWKGTHRYLFTAEHKALILASMNPQPVVKLQRPRKRARS